MLHLWRTRPEPPADPLAGPPKDPQVVETAKVIEVIEIIEVG